MRTKICALGMAIAAGQIGCGAPPKAAPTLPPLHLAPATDLVQAANVNLLVEVEPRALLAHAELARALTSVISDENFRVFRDSRGGVDVRELEELIYARYPQTTLMLARGVIDPAHVERDFAKRVTIEGRGVDRQADPLGSIIRTWGSFGDEREQLAIFGRELVGIESGHFGPLRSAEFFSEQKLRRASPALRAEPLKSAAAFLGAAPFRAIAIGPFEGKWKAALGGLAAASTAIALSVRPTQSDAAHDGDLVAVTIALFGSWGDDADAASARLAAAVDLVRASSLGALLGLDNAVVGPTKRITPSVITVDATFKTEPFFRGIRDATSSSVPEILGGGLE